VARARDRSEQEALDNLARALTPFLDQRLYATNAEYHAFIATLPEIVVAMVEGFAVRTKGSQERIDAMVAAAEGRPARSRAYHPTGR